MEKGKFIIISGPSGAGKGTICDILMKDMNAGYSVSSTTRSPREGEIDGVNYHFISVNEFESKIKNGEMLEYNFYNGNYYGTSKSGVLDMIEKGIDVFLEIDVNGGHQIKKLFPDAITIFIDAPSDLELRNRLINRGTETIEKIKERIETAKEERLKASDYDAYIINDDLDNAINHVKKVINNRMQKS